MNPAIIQELSEQWTAASKLEKQANAERLAIEGKMLELFVPIPEGTAECGNIKVTYKITRKVDSQALREMWDTLSDNSKRCFKWDAKVTLAEFRTLQNTDVQAYVNASKFITSTPAKPTISLKEEL